MNQFSGKPEGSFVVATPARSVCDDNAVVLCKHGFLRFLALGTRKGVKGVPPEFTRLNPAWGLVSTAAAMTLSPRNWESIRFRMHPWFDRWVRRQLLPGNHVISSYGYVNDSFKWARKNGGKTFLDGGNSHPENFWTILSEEHARWNCPYPPIARHHYERSLAMMEHVDYVLSPSSFVTESFLKRGFKPGQIIRNVYPADLSRFAPPATVRPKDRPLTLISTGSLSLRKGTPYLLEAFEIIRRKHPTARLLLNRIILNDALPVLKKYGHLDIDWAPSLNHEMLAKRLCDADIFLLPSLEDGFARTVTEALACGLPAIVSQNTGARDLIQPGVNGEVLPIRDPRAFAEAVLKWAEIVMNPSGPPKRLLDAEKLSFAHFEREFIGQLSELGLVPKNIR
jgi:glycosyltransferase involved in cell wall biosynthesis